MAMTAQQAPARKNGRKAPRRKAGEASIRDRRNANICSPRVSNLVPVVMVLH
jgi:hypothetical protein